MSDDDLGTLVAFRVLFDNPYQAEGDHEVMGWGIQLPTGLCYLDWNLKAYPPEDRLDHPHQSTYGSLWDVEQATGGHLQIISEHDAQRSLSDPSDGREPDRWAFDVGDELEADPSFHAGDADIRPTQSTTTVTKRLTSDDSTQYYFLSKDNSSELLSADAVEMYYQPIATDNAVSDNTTGDDVNASLD